MFFIRVKLSVGDKLKQFGGALLGTSSVFATIPMLLLASVHRPRLPSTAQ